MKQIPKTIENMLETPAMRTILDRTQDIVPVAREIINDWKVDLDKRKPAPATVLEDGTVLTSDFDMFTFLQALTERNAVINIPNYKNMAPKTFKTNQRIISSENRHGQVMGVISNEEAHSFSVRIKDYNVVEKRGDREIVGVPRNFAVVDYDGELGTNWSNIEFDPTPQEENKLSKAFVGDTLSFSHFSHPNLAFLVYSGKRYPTAKAAASRITEEAQFYRRMANDLRKQGVTIGGSYIEKGVTAKCIDDALSPNKSKVQVVEFKLKLPAATGEYPIKGMNWDGFIREHDELPNDYEEKQNVLRFSEQRANLLSYSLGTKVRAATRVVEHSYRKHGFKGGDMRYGNEIGSPWDSLGWEFGYRDKKGSKTLWNIRDYGNDVKLLYRILTRTVTRASEQ